MDRTYPILKRLLRASTAITLFAAFFVAVPGGASADTTVTLKVLDELGNGVPGGVATPACAGGWQSTLPGATDTNGELLAVLPACTTRVKMEVNQGSVEQTNAQMAASHYTWTTQILRIYLKDHSGAAIIDQAGLLDQGGGYWHAWGTFNASGYRDIPLFARSGAYKFRATYNSTAQEKLPVVTSGAGIQTFEFQTGQVVGACITQYNTGSWSTFTDGMELMPGTRVFRYPSQSGTVTAGGLTNLTCPSAPPTVSISLTAPNGGSPDGNPPWFKTAPIAGTVTADDTATGGNNIASIDCTAVTLSGLAGIGTSPIASGAFSIAAEGTTNISCTATDAAGNTSPPVTKGVKLDTTPPSLSGSATTPPNADGWYKGDVAIAWICSDAVSGIDGTCPSNSTITGEGVGLAAFASVSDKAGNTTTASSHVNADRTAPLTTADAPPAWNNIDVTVTLTASDNLSGVASTIYTIDGGAEQIGTSIPFSAEGSFSLEFWSVDKAGNEEAHHTVTVKIDKTSPTISHGQLPVANANGWNNTGVTVTFECHDALSGIASCTDPQTVSTEGLLQPVTGTAVDNAGNSAIDPATVSIDKTDPTIVGAVNPDPNANGWNNTDVTVTFECHDALSGIASCSMPQILGEGAGQSVTGTATDAAGNSADTTVSDINVDKTDPELTGEPTSDPNADGWYDDDVTIHWTCSDALSDIDGSCPADTIITGEGEGLSATASVSDRAGNAKTYTVDGINIDRTPPTVTASATSGGNQYFGGTWTNHEVSVVFWCDDELSDVGSLTDPVTLSTEGADQSASGTCVDKAGNSAEVTFSSINIDLTNPTIAFVSPTPANAHGWSNGDVTVTWSCTDSLSGPAEASISDTLSGEGASQSTTGTCTDLAGNTASDTQGGINIDKTDPTLSPSVSPNPVVLGGTATVTPNAADGLSDIDTQTCGALDTSSVGVKTVICTATDRAGNTNSASASYAVMFGWGGFLQPINDTAHQTGLLESRFKLGSTVPVKFRLTNSTGGTVQQTPDPTFTRSARLGACDSTTATESVDLDPGFAGTSFRWDAEARQYIFNWSTKGLTAGEYRIFANLADGTKHHVDICLR